MTSAARAVSATLPLEGVLSTPLADLVADAIPTGPAWLRSAREKARARFRERGLPTTHDEEWRFTSLAPLARTAFVRPDPALSARVEEAQVDAWRLAETAAELVFVDGVFSPSLSRIGSDHGLVLGTLRRSLGREEGDTLAPHLTRILGDRANAFADLNTALFEDGALVEVAAGAASLRPLHLLFVSSAQVAPTLALPRVLLRTAASSQVTIVETWAGFPGPARLTAAVTEIVVGENAEVRRYRVQDEPESAYHLSSLAVRLERNARFRDFSVSLGAALHRQDLEVDFAAEGGEATLDGILFADGERTSDTRSLIDHAHPHCSSRELYKGIVDGRGRGVFNGRIVVRAGAQKTDAAQANKNLLLSRGALVHSIPQLEILADDVKCRHGATTGQIDERALFYLRSRGLSADAARALLTIAFAADLVHRITLPELRERVARRLLSRLPGAEEVREAAL
jgi:Fe-S cluster assembly protein SufD